jgi:hypothetical protein
MDFMRSSKYRTSGLAPYAAAPAATAGSAMFLRSINTPIQNHAIWPRPKTAPSSGI